MARAMPTPNQIMDQINRLVVCLVEIGLADDQDFAFPRPACGNDVEITFQRANQVTVALKNRPYEEIYQHLLEARAYNVRMPDGALIQMLYKFSNETLQHHRLAFFPSPHLDQFQNAPEVYMEDEIYAEVVARRIVPFPVRFDYNAQDHIPQVIAHPKSHMSLGQYKNCRIPVTEPITPFWFIDFILRNFYNTAFHKFVEKLPKNKDRFAESIRPEERTVIHMSIPS